MSEIKEQDRKKDQEGQAAIKRLSKPIKVRILLAQIFTILSALLSFVPYLRNPKRRYNREHTFETAMGSYEAARKTSKKVINFFVLGLTYGWRKS